MRNVFDSVERVAVILAAAAVVWVLLISPHVGAGHIVGRRNVRKAVEAVPAKTETRLGAVTKRVGNPSVVLIEYSDFECPYCGQFAQTTLPQIDGRFIETGRVLYSFRNFPLDTIHPLAAPAAQASECARSQGQFWPFHDRLFAAAGALENQDLVRYAGALHLDVSRFESCLKQPESMVIATDRKEGVRLGVNSTPTFFVGKVDGQRVGLRLRIEGAQSYEVFRKAIEEALTS